MTTFADVPARQGTWLSRAEAWLRQGTWLSRAEAWLDARGKGAWIALMVLAFIVFWPAGLVILAYMLFAGKFSGGCAMSRRAPRFTARGSSGNAAFDAYRAETLRRLEDEQEAFEAFLKRLREAKDKAEFDQFMEDRARKRETRDDADKGDDTAKPIEA